jgi:tRNA uridine 5-carboxymethylaminomethyl modification enzyme
LLSNPLVDIARLKVAIPALLNIPPSMEHRLNTEGRYEKYLQFQSREIREYQKDFDMEIPSSLDYKQLDFLSNEAKDRLSKQRPSNYVS